MTVVLGVGGREGADTAALLDLAAKALAEHGRRLDEVEVVATLDRRADHAGVQLLAVAAEAGIRPFASDELAAQQVDEPSVLVAGHVGTPSVAEAAVRACGAEPLGPASRGDGWVVVVGRPFPPSRATISHISGGQKEHLGGDGGLGHHGDVEVEPGMLDFAVNVHGEEPPPFLLATLTKALHDLARYPDPRRAEAAVAAAHGVPPECVRLTHGAAEAFTLIAQQPWRQPLVVHPQFTEPEAALRAAGHRPEHLVLAADTGFRLPADPGDATHDLVVVGNPTNPTSRLHARADVLGLRGDDPCLLVVDEAFLDTVEDIAEPRHSLAREAAADPGLLVVRSLTKTYALAGLRVGYLVGHPDTLARLTRRRSPWPVSTPAAAAAEACVSEQGRQHAAAFRAELPSRLDHLSATLTAHGFAVVDDPRGPFVLARHPEAHAVRSGLRTHGIAVRRGDTFPGLDNGWLRFAAREPAAVDALAARLGRA